MLLNCFNIINDLELDIYFYCYNYKNWFYKVEHKDIRRIKLEKISRNEKT